MLMGQSCNDEVKYMFADYMSWNVNGLLQVGAHNRINGE